MELFNLLDRKTNAYFSKEHNHVLLTFDDNYFNHSVNLMMSMLAHDKELSFICLCPQLTKENVEILMNLDFGVDLYSYNCTADVNLKKWPISSIFRMFSPWLIDEDIKEVLYLDSDIIVTNKLTELFNEKNYLIMMATEISGNLRNYTYFGKRYPLKVYCNSGVMKFNLERLRLEYTFDDIATTFIKKAENYTCPDQDFFNEYFDEKLTRINGCYYNAQIYEYNKSCYFPTLLSSAKIIHFTGLRPWKYTSPLFVINLYLKHSLYPPMIKVIKKVKTKRILLLPFIKIKNVFKRIKSKLFK